ncbi:hypothetical protein JYT55_01165 [Mariprofundus ferrooxydans]|nr:hypothetical protein [Mariprofundus ferrooxydans]
MIKDAELKLGQSGRVNVRASGTEPKLRVMIEAESATLMHETGDALVKVLEQKIQALM